MKNSYFCSEISKISLKNYSEKNNIVVSISFNFNQLAFIVLVLFVLAWLVQMLYHWILFRRLAFYKKNEKSTAMEPVSVIVCARDSYEYLLDLIPAVLSQDYPDFELVIVNDCSQDQTEEYLKELARNNPKINLVNLTQNLNFFQGKKFPLSMGIKSAKHDLLLLTDADCVPTTDQWIKEMVSAYRNNTEIVVAYGPYFERKGLLNKLIRFDTLYIAMQYLSLSLAKKTYMGVGRNLSYRKSTFMKNKGFTSHYNIPSGDDDLFISQVANKRNTRVYIDAVNRVESEPKRSWGTWIRQKRRHYSTGIKYKSNINRILGLLLGSRLIYYPTLVSLFILPAAFEISLGKIYYFVVIGFFALLHYITQVIIYHKSAKQLGEKHLGLAFTPIYDCFFMIFTTIIGFWSTISKPKGW